MTTESGIDVRSDLPVADQQIKAPEPAPAGAAAVPIPPDGLGYRLKRRLLGEPLHSEALSEQRLGKPSGLAIMASDNLSSSAYATEEMLHVLVPAVGAAAFSLVMPLTTALLLMLGLLILSYRQTIKAYPSSGGAYLVTRDAFGLVWAQVAGVALLLGYLLTVAVSVSAGAAALISSFEGLADYRVPIALGFIVLVGYGNLRGIRESGKVFATPTYFFMLNVAVLLGYGLVRYVGSDLPLLGEEGPGTVHFGHGDAAGLFLGASAFTLAKAYASGGAAVTGVEAISNGVSSFRPPEWKNARQTLVLMGAGLAVMFLGISFLASEIEIVPFEDGTPTVLAQIGEAVYGTGAVGDVLTYSLQFSTLLILVLAANTGFAGFPALASFQANDSFLPRQLTQRGHRLVFSNGIFALAGTAAVLVVATNAEVTKLIPLYAIGVFIGFTLSQAGMTRWHTRHKEPGWKKSIVINGAGAAISAAVVVIVTVTKFSIGAWVMVIAMPLLVFMLLRLNRQYEREAVLLETDVPAAATAPILRRHVVLVFVDRLDMASARAIQYARTLTPDELRAVHFVLDDEKAQELAEEWARTGLARVPLELVDCPDRRLTRAAVECVVRELADGETEVSVLLPDRKYRGIWHRVLHDKTADAILEEVSRLPHANVTTVPFHLDARERERVPLSAIVSRREPSGEGRGLEQPRPGAADADLNGMQVMPGATPIIDARWRDHVTVAGRVRAVRVAPLHDAPTLELILVDGTASISVLFLGRRSLAGVGVGTTMAVTGTVGIHKTRLAILNPSYQLL
jgi:amino acid transporter